MDRFWKQFAGSAIASEHKVFFKARLKLTALYVLIVAVIILGFSVFLYQSIGRNLTDTNDDDFVGAAPHQHFVQNALDSLQYDLAAADIVILLLAAGFSFILAGKTLRPIQRSVETQKAFASNASHELRTPLAVMRNDVEVFLRNSSPTTVQATTTMKSNLEEISRMSSIVEDLLLLARSEDQAMTKHEDIDLGLLTKKTAERVQFIAESKGIHLTYSHATDIGSKPLTIRGARGPLERAILNILQNSIEHTPSGGSIEVVTRKEGANIIVRIKDTGSGIAAHDLPHIFKRFYKGGSATGTGLGLSIVQEIITQHAGQISIESTEHVGTTVTIAFPSI